jgi:hypothetical protein
VLALAAAPDSTWLATVSDDHTVQIWQVASGALVITALATGYPISLAAWTSDVSVVVGGHRGPYFLRLSGPPHNTTHSKVR